VIFGGERERRDNATVQIEQAKLDSKQTAADLSFIGREERKVVVIAAFCVVVLLKT
jgi:hypothetical protein